MQLGMIGLGRMGEAMTRRLARAGIEVAGYDLDAAARARSAEAGASAAESVAALVGQLAAPRAIWLMLPEGEPTALTIAELAGLLGADDVVIDGGNNHYERAAAHAAALAARGIGFLDVGTSGGVRGERDGFSLMIGGDEQVVERLRPVFAALAPSPERGWGRVGPVGAGHFVKMVHNGIEYGAMQAFAEGFAILDAKRELGLDLGQVAGIWQDGSVVRSWLLDLIAEILDDENGVEQIEPVVADSGEGRWTVQEAIALDVAAPVIALSLMARLKSRDEREFGERLLAAMRHRFGGHAIEKNDKK